MLLGGVSSGCDNLRVGDTTNLCGCSCTRDGFVYDNFTTWVCYPDGYMGPSRCQAQCERDSGFASCLEPLESPYSTDSCVAPSLLRESDALATESLTAIHGELDPQVSFALVTSGQDFGLASLDGGDVYLHAPNGPHMAGPAQVTLLRVTSGPFAVGGHAVTAVEVLNNGHLAGSIDADDQFVFPTGSVNGWGTVDSTFVSREFASTSAQTGYVDYADNFMVFEGEYVAESVRVTFHLVFRFSNESRPPRARITVTPDPGGRGWVTLDAGSSTDPAGIPIIASRWLRHAGGPRPITIGRTSTLRVNPGGYGRNAITLEVLAADGQWDVEEICFHPRGCVH